MNQLTHENGPFIISEKENQTKDNENSAKSPHLTPIFKFSENEQKKQVPNSLLKFTQNSSQTNNKSNNNNNNNRTESQQNQNQLSQPPIIHPQYRKSFHQMEQQYQAQQVQMQQQQQQQMFQLNMNNQNKNEVIKKKNHGFFIKDQGDQQINLLSVLKNRINTTPNFSVNNSMVSNQQETQNLQAVPQQENMISFQQQNQNEEKKRSFNYEQLQQFQTSYNNNYQNYQNMKKNQYTLPHRFKFPGLTQEQIKNYHQIPEKKQPQTPKQQQCETQQQQKQQQKELSQENNQNSINNNETQKSQKNDSSSISPKIKINLIQDDYVQESPPFISLNNQNKLNFQQNLYTSQDSNNTPKQQSLLNIHYNCSDPINIPTSGSHLRLSNSSVFSPKNKFFSGQSLSEIGMGFNAYRSLSNFSNLSGSSALTKKSIFYQMGSRSSVPNMADLENEDEIGDAFLPVLSQSVLNKREILKKEDQYKKFQRYQKVASHLKKSRLCFDEHLSQQSLSAKEDEVEAQSQADFEISDSERLTLYIPIVVKRGKRQKICLCQLKNQEQDANEFLNLKTLIKIKNEEEFIKKSEPNPPPSKKSQGTQTIEQEENRSKTNSDNPVVLKKMSIRATFLDQMKKSQKKLSKVLTINTNLNNSQFTNNSNTNTNTFSRSGKMKKSKTFTVQTMRVPSIFDEHTPDIIEKQCDEFLLRKQQSQPQEIVRNFKVQPEILKLEKQENTTDLKEQQQQQQQQQQQLSQVPQINQQKYLVKESLLPGNKTASDNSIKINKSQDSTGDIRDKIALQDIIKNTAEEPQKSLKIPINDQKQEDKNEEIQADNEEDSPSKYFGSIKDFKVETNQKKTGFNRSIDKECRIKRYESREFQASDLEHLKDFFKQKTLFDIKKKEILKNEQSENSLHQSEKTDQNAADSDDLFSGNQSQRLKEYEQQQIQKQQQQQEEQYNELRAKKISIIRESIEMTDNSFSETLNHSINSRPSKLLSSTNTIKNDDTYNNNEDAKKQKSTKFQRLIARSKTNVDKQNEKIKNSKFKTSANSPYMLFPAFRQNQPKSLTCTIKSDQPRESVQAQELLNEIASKTNVSEIVQEEEEEEKKQIETNNNDFNNNINLLNNNNQDQSNMFQLQYNEQTFRKQTSSNPSQEGKSSDDSSSYSSSNYSKKQEEQRNDLINCTKPDEIKQNQGQEEQLQQQQDQEEQKQKEKIKETPIQSIDSSSDSSSNTHSSSILSVEKSPNFPKTVMEQRQANPSSFSPQKSIKSPKYSITSFPRSSTDQVPSQESQINSITGKRKGSILRNGNGGLLPPTIPGDNRRKSVAFNVQEEKPSVFLQQEYKRRHSSRQDYLQQEHLTEILENSLKVDKKKKKKKKHFNLLSVKKNSDNNKKIDSSFQTDTTTAVKSVRLQILQKKFKFPQNQNPHSFNFLVNSDQDSQHSYLSETSSPELSFSSSLSYHNHSYYSELESEDSSSPSSSYSLNRRKKAKVQKEKTITQIHSKQNSKQNNNNTNHIQDDLSFLKDYKESKKEVNQFLRSLKHIQLPQQQQEQEFKIREKAESHDVNVNSKVPLQKENKHSIQQCPTITITVEKPVPAQLEEEQEQEQQVRIPLVNITEQERDGVEGEGEMKEKQNEIRNGGGWKYNQLSLPITPISCNIKGQSGTVNDQVTTISNIGSFTGFDMQGGNSSENWFFPSNNTHQDPQQQLLQLQQQQDQIHETNGGEKDKLKEKEKEIHQKTSFQIPSLQKIQGKDSIQQNLKTPDKESYDRISLNRNTSSSVSSQLVQFKLNTNNIIEEQKGIEDLTGLQSYFNPVSYSKFSLGEEEQSQVSDSEQNNNQQRLRDKYKKKLKGFKEKKAIDSDENIEITQLYIQDIFSLPSLTEKEIWELIDEQKKIGLSYIKSQLNKISHQQHNILSNIQSNSNLNQDSVKQRYKQVQKEFLENKIACYEDEQNDYFFSFFQHPQLNQIIKNPTILIMLLDAKYLIEKQILTSYNFKKEQFRLSKIQLNKLKLLKKFRTLQSYKMKRSHSPSKKLIIRQSSNSNENQTISDVEASHYQDSVAQSQYLSYIQQPFHQQDHTHTFLDLKPHNEQKLLEQTIISLGSTGAFGRVRQILNFKDKQFYAVKTFYRLEHYQNEKKTYTVLNEVFGEKFKNYGISVSQQDDQQQQLYFKLGIVNFREFIDYRKQEKIEFLEKELLYVFKTLVEFVFFLFDKGYFHGDIKPANIVLERISKSDYQRLRIKMIDFAGATNNWEMQSMITPLYFNSFKRNKFLCNIPQFQSKEQRFKNEIYSVIRTFMDICVNQYHTSEKIKDLFKIPLNEMKSSEENCLKIFQSIKTDIYPLNYQNSPAFKKLIDFMEQKLLQEDYEIQELRDFICNKELFNFKSDNHLNTSHNSYTQLLNSECIFDNQNICVEMIQKNLNRKKNFRQSIRLVQNTNNNNSSNNNTNNNSTRKKSNDLYSSQNITSSQQIQSCNSRNIVEEDEDPLTQLFNQKIYIGSIQCKENEENSDLNLDLYTLVQLFLHESTKDSQIYLILGDMGFGKSAFLTHLQNKISDNKVIYFLKLEKFGTLSKLKHYINIVYQNITDTSQQIIFLLDGFEVLFQQSQEEIIRKFIEIFFQEKLFKQTKIIITSRKSNFPLEDFKNVGRCYSVAYKLSYIQPFNDTQIQQFIKRYIQEAAEKFHYYNIKFYHQESQYLEQFKRYPGFKQIIANPLILRLILEFFPLIEQQLQNYLQTQQEELLKEIRELKQQIVKLWNELKPQQITH